MPTPVTNNEFLLLMDLQSQLKGWLTENQDKFKSELPTAEAVGNSHHIMSGINKKLAKDLGYTTEQLTKAGLEFRAN